MALAASVRDRLHESERSRRRLLERWRTPRGRGFVEVHLEAADGAFVQRVVAAFAARPGASLLLLIAGVGGAALFALAAQESAAETSRRWARASRRRSGAAAARAAGKAGDLTGRDALVAELGASGAV